VSAHRSYCRKGKHIYNSTLGFIAAAVASALLASATLAQTSDDKHLAASIDKVATAAVAAGGYALILSQQEGHRKIAHGGGIYGFSASLSQFPDDKTTVVVLSNAIGKDVGVFKIADRIERLALGLPAKK
jgi:hypothetical protein